MKKLKIGFIVIFLVLLILPMILFDVKSKISIRENRVLATIPLAMKENALNIAIFSDIDKYISDRFGLRNNLLRLNNRLNHALGKQSEKVLAGKDGWLFYIAQEDGDNLKDYLKDNLMTENDVLTIVEGIKNRSVWCAENNIEFIFMITPNKHNIYEEYYQFDRPSGINRTEQITAAMNKSDVKYIYSKDLMLRKKQEQDLPLYYKLGTHWNQLGAYFAYKEELLPQLKSMFPKERFGETNYSYSVQNADGGDKDLANMLNIGGLQAQPVISFEPMGKNWSDLYIEEKGADRYMETQAVNKKTLKAIVFRDSFFEALQPFISGEFSIVKYNWEIFRESDKAYVLQNKPDVVIFEIQERYLHKLVGSLFNKQ